MLKPEGDGTAAPLFFGGIMLKAQILFTDLDGTLLNDQKEITPGNRRAVNQALAAGRRIVVTSGRPLVSSLDQARRLELAGPGCFVIAYNGAEIYDCSLGRSVFRSTVAMEDLLAVFAEARRRGAFIQTYDNEQVVFEPWCKPDAAQWYTKRLGMTCRIIEDVGRDLSAPPVKALLIDREGTGVLDEMERWISTELAGRVDCFRSSAWLLEVVAAGMNKGAAVERLCGMLGIPLSQAAAAGDEANDVSMIRMAGVGAAMANAVPAAKMAADYITEQDNNHDGVAEIIWKFML